ncbi:MAG TPA: DUF4169 family protein [Rhizomicrobium sp.]|jgi:hypothetical protein|nr:DUF4169 family protein [Rhizomicrobium sp.]
MAEIVNLRRARKARARTEKQAAAEANRLLHGTPKAVRKLEEARREQRERRLGGHALEKNATDK